MKKLIISLVALIFIVNLFSVGFISAEDIWADPISASLTIDVGFWCPDPDGKNWIDTTTPGNPSYSTVYILIDKVYDCRNFFGAENWEIDSNSCCPEDNHCLKVTSDEEIKKVFLIPGTIDSDRWRCIVTYGKNVCGDYTPDGKEACEQSSTKSIAEFSMETRPDINNKNYCNTMISWKDLSEGDCSAFRSCMCVWDSATSTCTVDKKLEDATCTENIPETSCQYNVTYDDSACSEPRGMIEMTWTRVSGIAEDCPDSTNQISCKNITRLSFFTLINIIAIIVILVVIYYLYAISKKKRKKFKKKRR